MHAALTARQPSYHGRRIARFSSIAPRLARLNRHTCASSSSETLPLEIIQNAPFTLAWKQHFVENYWQKRPLLIRQFLPGFQSPVTGDELAGLACDDTLKARVYMEVSAQTNHGN